MLHPLDAEEGPLALAARIGVVDERRLEHRFKEIEQQVLDDAVPELTCENLPFHRDGNHEDETRTRHVCPVPQLVEQVNEVPFQVHLEGQLAFVVAFVLPCGQVGLHQQAMQLLLSQFVYHPCTSGLLYA